MNTIIGWDGHKGDVDKCLPCIDMIMCYYAAKCFMNNIKRVLEQHLKRAVKKTQNKKTNT